MWKTWNLMSNKTLEKNLKTKKVNCDIIRIWKFIRKNKQIMEQLFYLIIQRLSQFINKLTPK